jgi:hypothetical protein
MIRDGSGAVANAQPTTRTFVLPPDPWWLLRVQVDEGGSTPYHLWIWWAWQWCVPKELNA